jgi:hypothetical protein
VDVDNLSNFDYGHLLLVLQFSALRDLQLWPPPEHT